MAAFAQAVGANALLLGATMALAVSSALCFVLAASRGDVVELPAPQKGIGSAYVRVGAAMGCFGFLFAMMIMQFVIAPSASCARRGTSCSPCASWPFR